MQPDQVDALRFQSLVGAATRARVDGQWKQAASQLQTALALWRGAALPEFATRPFAVAEVARLEELRLRAVEDRIDALLLEGLNSGEPNPVTQEYWDEKKRKLTERLGRTIRPQ